MPAKSTGSSRTPAKVTFKVKDVVRGNVKDSQIDAYRVNGTFTMPKPLCGFVGLYGSTVRVGLVSPEIYVGWCRKVNARTGDGRPLTLTDCSGEFIGGRVDRPPHRPYIMNTGCSPSFIVPDYCTAILSLPRRRNDGIVTNQKRNPCAMILHGP